MRDGPLKGVRGRILHCLGNPDQDANAVEFFNDGLLLFKNGLIEGCGPAECLQRDLPQNIEVEEYPDHLIVPGFIDCHVHYPQMDMIASHSGGLLDWLDEHTFPAERKLADRHYAEDLAKRFIDELLKRGTTTACVFGSVHGHSVDAVFRAARDKNMRLIAGKVLMDRNCPEDLQDDEDAGESVTRELIERWHEVERLRYAITPRFAPTSSEKQLKLAGQLAAEYPDVYVHSHLSETQAEGDWVQELFPESRNYLDVYDRFGLVRSRTIYAHCIHLSDQERHRMAEADASIAFCPSSNLFLGSGLFNLSAASGAGVRVGLGTDVGAGTDLGLLPTLGDAYKAIKLSGENLSPALALYLVTLGAARALDVASLLGNFESGKEADFIVLGRNSNSLVRHRLEAVNDGLEWLFALTMLGDERSVVATHVMGERVSSV